VGSRIRLNPEFLQADVYEAVEAIGGRKFDVVSTGIGAIHWLPDITRWATVMARLLVSGGRFYMAEFHPFASVFADDELVVVDSYFDPGPHVHTTPGSYADPTAHTTHNTRVTWNHALGDVVTSLAEASLVIDFLHEHPYALRPCWPFLERNADRTYRMPSGQPQLPLLYSIRARRPAG
jgi:hypothetical protein